MDGRKIKVTGVKYEAQDKKILLIKAFRVAFELGLKESKDAVESLLESYNDNIGGKSPQPIIREPDPNVPPARFTPHDNA